MTEYGQAPSIFRALTSDSEPIFSLFTHIVNSPQPLHPYTHVDSSHDCVAMITDLVKNPVWIQIPCNEPLLTYWICKAQIIEMNVNSTGVEKIQNVYLASIDVGMESASRRFMCVMVKQTVKLGKMNKVVRFVMIKI